MKKAAAGIQRQRVFLKHLVKPGLDVFQKFSATQRGSSDPHRVSIETIRDRVRRAYYLALRQFLPAAQLLEFHSNCDLLRGDI